MKTILFLLISVFLVTESYSLDTNIVKYMPLKTGNVWVYSSFVTGKLKLAITGTQVQNGHTYYIFQQTGTPCFCALGNYPPFLMTLPPMRIDSTTGNLMIIGSGCTWYIGERVLDSLRGKIGVFPNNSCNTGAVFDTSIQTVFGSPRKTISIDTKLSPYSAPRRYAFGIGLYSSSIQCTMIPASSCQNTLTGCVIDGVAYGDTTFPVGVTQISSEVPESFSLYQNYPNPFNPSTKIKFDVPPLSFGEGNAPEARGVRLAVYNALGQEVSILVDEQLQPGTYEVEWVAAEYPSGIYYYKLEAGDYNQTKKMVLIK